MLAEIFGRLNYRKTLNKMILKSENLVIYILAIATSVCVQAFKGHNFVDDQNPGFFICNFIFVDHLLSTLVLHVHCDCF